MSNATKVTGLTRLNHAALNEVLPEGSGVKVTATTATFPMDAAGASTFMARVIAEAALNYGAKGHPVQSLHAVKNKIDRLGKLGKFADA